MLVHDASRLARRSKTALLVLCSYVTIRTSGFWLLGWPKRTLLHALYLSFNILSTVGNWTEAFGPGEELWAILMMGFAITGAGYGFSTLMAMVTSGEIQRALGRRQMTGKIQALRNHYIVCGYGRMGRAICRELLHGRVAFVLIDHDPQRTTQAEQEGCLTLTGDASDEATLLAAQIQHAQGLVTNLAHDADNVYVTLTARGLFGQLPIIARAESEGAEPRLKRAGATRVVSPADIGAVKVIRSLLHPALEDLIDGIVQEGLAIDRIHVGRLHDVAGHTLRELSLPGRFGVTVLAVERPGAARVFNPPADHPLSEADQLIVVGPRPSVERLMQVCGG